MMNLITDTAELGNALLVNSLVTTYIIRQTITFTSNWISTTFYCLKRNKDGHRCRAWIIFISLHGMEDGNIHLIFVQLGISR